MGIYVYAGWERQDGVWSYRPATDADFLEYASTALNEQFSQEDLLVYNHVRDQYENAGDQDLQYAWWKVFQQLPLGHVDGSLCGLRTLKRKGVDLPTDEDGCGNTDDQAVIRAVFTALGLNPEAAALVQKLYWG
jgi:hypothetical protein